jgi:thymidine kinase
MADDTVVYRPSGDRVQLRDLKVDDCIVTPDRYSKIIKISEGTAYLYRVFYKDGYFDVTDTHIMVCKNYKYKYHPYNDTRGFILYYDKDRKLASIPCLKKYAEKVAKANEHIMLEEGTDIELPLSSFIKNRWYCYILYMYKYPIQFLYKKPLKPIDDNNFFQDIENAVLTNSINIRINYLQKLVFTTMSLCKFDNTCIKLYSKCSYLFKNKLTRLCESLCINVCFYDESIVLDISCLELFNFVIKKKFIEVPMYGIYYTGTKRFIGLELEGTDKFVLDDGIVSHNSTYVKNIINRYKVIDKKLLVISHSNDKNRYSSINLSTHNEVTDIPCFFTDNLENLKDTDKYNEADIIVIEEAQFFKDLDKFVINELDTTNKNFVVCGLSGDYNRKPFEVISNLIPHADKLHKLSAFCLSCNDTTDAIYTKLDKQNLDNVKEGNILVGKNNIYSSVCRKHYNV